MSLRKYNQKRHFSKTPEPAGKKHTRGKVLHFVVQKHDATRLHYDFRLEMDGVLKSWAVPKGPSLNPEDKHLAMMVEDHPFDYRNFEGVIPEGNYGAGNVIVWDEGTYEALGPIPKDMSEEEFLLSELKKGSVKIILHGKKLKGEFALFPFKKAGDNAWILKKHDDDFASKEDILREDTSVKSGLTVDEVGEKKKALKKEKEDKKQAMDVTKTVKIIKKAASKSSMPHEVEPMLAELADFPFDNKDWLYEIKWDGYRAIAEIQKGEVRLYSRNNIDFNSRYPSIIDVLEAVPYDAVFDGEIVVLDQYGKSQFQMLQDYGQRKQGTLVYYVFDLLYLDGYDLRSLPLVERKKFLHKIIKETELVRYSDHIEEHGLKLYALAKRKGYEGVVAKKKNSKYTSRRTAEWLKIKNIQTQEAVICGFTEPKGMRKDFGALVLGLYDNNELRYIGHAGGGFDQQKLSDVLKKLKPLITKKSPFTIDPKTNTPVTWVKPKLVCQVKFSEWTNGGIMRQPVFLGMREDKKAKDVKDEVHTDSSKIRSDKEVKPSKEERIIPDTKIKGKRILKLAKKEAPIKRGKAELTNLNKIYWPDEGYTKGELINYYDAIADYILPYLKDRPLSLNRFPDGIEGQNFFQKDLVHRPDWVKTVPIFSEHDQRNLNWLICNDKDTLLYVANLGSIEINPWNSRYRTLEKPDYMIIDLDPEGIPFKEVIKTAKLVKHLLDSIHVDAFLKTSGKTGLHILVPLGAKYSYEQTKQFAQVIVNMVFAKLPDTTSVVRDPKKREHKIYLDFLQNRGGQTIAAPYCVRPVPQAPVSTPLEWTELRESLDPRDYTIKTIMSRLKKKGDIWKPFREHKGVNMLASLKALTSL